MEGGVGSCNRHREGGFVCLYAILVSRNKAYLFPKTSLVARAQGGERRTTTKAMNGSYNVPSVDAVESG